MPLGFRPTLLPFAPNQGLRRCRLEFRYGKCPFKGPCQTPVEHVQVGLLGSGVFGEHFRNSTQIGGILATLFELRNSRLMVRSSQNLAPSNFLCLCRFRSCAAHATAHLGTPTALLCAGPTERVVRGMLFTGFRTPIAHLCTKGAQILGQRRHTAHPSARHHTYIRAFPA